MTGIITAMNCEAAYLESVMKDTEKKKIGAWEFTTGKIGSTQLVLAVCGIGKVFAGSCAQTMITSFGCTHIFNVGVAGSLDPKVKIGDIVCREDEAYVFAVRDTAPFICSEVTRVRHTTVTAQIIAPSECPTVVTTKEESASVSSERVDCLAAQVFHLSRSQAQRLIEQEKIFADGRIITSASYIPSAGERISVRGYGKFRYLGTDGRTRKGRLIARYERYI